MVSKTTGRGPGVWIAVGLVLTLMGLTVVPAAFAQSAGVQKIGVIDVQRILTDSQAGKDAIKALRAVNDQKVAELESKRTAIEDLQSRIDEGRLSLSEERLAEMQKELEEQVIAFRRLEDDANRALQKQRDEAFSKIERRVMPIITQVGQELGFTMIFNKFQSGLVFAQEGIDITDVILERFDAAAEQPAAQPAAEQGS